MGESRLWRTLLCYVFPEFIACSSQMQGGLETWRSCVRTKKTQMVCCVLNTVVATFLSLALEADLGLRFSVSSSQEPLMRCRLSLRITSSTLESVVNAIDLIHLSTTAGWAPVRRQQFREGRMTLLEPPEMLLLPFHKF